MARRISLTLASGGVAVPASQTDKTLFIYSPPTNQRSVIDEINISFDGITNTDTPVEVRIQKCTFSGGTTSALTMREKQILGSGETIQGTAVTVSAEPTYANVKLLKNQAIHPQLGGGNSFAFGRSIVLAVGESIAVIVKPGANNHAINARADADLDE